MDSRPTLHLPSSRRVRLGGAALVAALAAAALPAAAQAAVTASYEPDAQLLMVFGDSAANTVTISRNAAGRIVVNGGAVAIAGGQPSIANTSSMHVFGMGGGDALTLSEASGALPPAFLFGGAGADSLTGGSSADQLFGQLGNDTLLGKAGADLLADGEGNDTATGGDGDDRALLGAGNDRFVWNPGDDTDAIDDTTGVDTVEFNGGNGDEALTATVNGQRVRLDRVNPAPVALDIENAVENVVVKAAGGNDTFSATGNLAAATKLTVDGGAGDDTLRGGNGVDVLLGGEGSDLVEGKQDNDIALLGAGDDRFGWSPGDGSDTVEGQDGTDRLSFDGSGAGERLELAANGPRVRLTRDVASIVMDLGSVEQLAPSLAGGADTLSVGDLTGTAATAVDADLAPLRGGTAPDAVDDRVVVRGTNGAETVQAAGPAGDVSVIGLAASLRLRQADPTDSLAIETQGGDDAVDARPLAAGAARLVVDAGDGDDTVIGGRGADVLVGGAGDDDVTGGPGGDVALLGDHHDRFAWAPGDGSDTVEGQSGDDRLSFNGSNVGERIALSANGGRVMLQRDVASVLMDLDGLERVDAAVLGGADTVTVGDLSGTDLTLVNPQLGLAAFGSTGDTAVDLVQVDGTNADDRIAVSGNAGRAAVTGLAAITSIIGAELRDKLEIRGLGGVDTLDTAGLRPTIRLAFVQ